MGQFDIRKWVFFTLMSISVVLKYPIVGLT